MSDDFNPATDYNPAAITVDVSKLRPGDYVTVRTKVLACMGAGANAMPVTIDPNPWANEIGGHEPAA